MAHTVKLIMLPIKDYLGRGDSSVVLALKPVCCSQRGWVNSIPFFHEGFIYQSNATLCRLFTVCMHAHDKDSKLTVKVSGLENTNTCMQEKNKNMGSAVLW